MPLHTVLSSRRQFLLQGSAAIAGCAVSRVGWSAPAQSPSIHLALLSDTHIPGDPGLVHLDAHMTDNLHRAVSEICASPRNFDAAIVNGDCAFNRGLPEDYVNFVNCVEPLAAAGIPLHLTMGNHDARDPFYEAFNGLRPQPALVASRHVAVIETPVANLFLLDSLQQTNIVTGEFGQEQRNWLARELDARPNVPAVLVAHHPPQFTPPEEGKVWTGLLDTAPFFELIAARKQVKAFVFGHSHRWHHSQMAGVHLVNLPPVAYVFRPEDPNGWVEAELFAEGMNLSLRPFSPAPQYEKSLELRWV